ncbi:MAG: four-helix bundle copper-binding protein [Caulobacteraceae bacterium]|nr:four-helix bundle copper-binding protein [Caulobacteraceae bacterium]
MEPHPNSLSVQTRECIRALAECHAVCVTEATVRCLETGGEHARPQHLRLMADCAAVCRLASDFLVQKSQFQHRICVLCADICEVCAADCEKLGQMEECREACRRAAALCRMVSHPEHAELLAMASSLPPGR